MIRGFTLLEVMVTTAILALGAVLLYEAFFLSLDVNNYCVNYLALSSLASEKIWEAQDAVSHLGSDAILETSGEIGLAAKKITWDLSYSGGEEGLYPINLVISWNEGAHAFKLIRNAYAFKPK
jgi:prepilin-type N-terminal cleavage/methylation domain-containing protein